VRHRNAGLIADPLFIGATRPSMLWGVTYSAVMLNAMCIMELFLLTKNLLILLLAAPIHGVCMLLCARDARVFDLMLLWGRTRLPALFGNLRFWKASSYSPLVLDVPNARGLRRRGAPISRVARIHSRTRLALMDIAQSPRSQTAGSVRTGPPAPAAGAYSGGTLP
jgi:type IV secretion system protein VirB3